MHSVHFLSCPWPWALYHTICISIICCCCSTAKSCLTLWDPMDCSLPASSVHEDSPGNNTGVGCHALLRGISLTQGLNQCSLISCLLAALQNAYFHTCKNVWNITILQGSLPLHPYQSPFTNHKGSWILKKKPSNKIYRLYVRGWQFFAVKG